MGTAYYVPVDVDGGVALYTWTVTTGSLPPGLDIVADATQGTPTTAAAFTLQVSDSQSTPYTGTRDFSVKVFAADQLAVTVTRHTDQAGQRTR